MGAVGHPGKGENARTTGSRLFQWFAAPSIPMPFLANAAGWVFTEIGRQPWGSCTPIPTIPWCA